MSVRMSSLSFDLDVSSPPSPVSPSGCDDDDALSWSCLCCFLSRMSAMMSAVVRIASGGSAVRCCSSGCGHG